MARHEGNNYKLSLDQNVKRYIILIEELCLFIKHNFIFLDRRKCFDVCHSVHYQRVVGVPCILVDILYHGCSIFWRKVLQMRR